MLNRALLLGYVGSDPDVRVTQSSQPVANFRLATTKRWKKNGQDQERTDWHSVVAWGTLAEFCGRYVKKGTCLFVEGELQSSSYTDREGTIRYKHELRADRIQFGAPKAKADADSPPSNSDRFVDENGSQEPSDDVPF